MSEQALAEKDLAAGRLRNWVAELGRRLHDAFLPDPADVSPDYLGWLRWRLSQRFFSSTMQNFSLSALLMATGLGAKQAFAGSAAINWLLKDGVSRIVRMVVSTSFGQTFDADLKRMRFTTSLIFTACMAGEFLTPFWPQHFVALASLSSVGRAVGLSAFVATQPAFQAALATGGNLADLTSKNQAQHMVMDMMALGVSAGLTWLCRGLKGGELLLPALMYPLCAAGDLTCIWHELKAVHLRVLNRERAELIIDRWMARQGAVPAPEEISAAESLVLPSSVCGGLLPLAIMPLERLDPCMGPKDVLALLDRYSGEEYMLTVRAPPHAQQRQHQHQQQAQQPQGPPAQHQQPHQQRAGASSSSATAHLAATDLDAGDAHHHHHHHHKHHGSDGSRHGRRAGHRGRSTDQDDGAEGDGGDGSSRAGSGAEASSSGRSDSGGGPLEALHRRLPPWMGGPEPYRIVMSLSDRAKPPDILQALLHAAHLRQAVLQRLSNGPGLPYCPPVQPCSADSASASGCATAAGAADPLPPLKPQHHDLQSLAFRQLKAQQLQASRQRLPAAAAGCAVGSGLQGRDCSPLTVLGLGDVGHAGLLMERLRAEEWARLLSVSHEAARRDRELLMSSMGKAGWKMWPFMLNTTERVQYIRL